MTREQVQLKLVKYAIQVDWCKDKMFTFIAKTLNRKEYLMLPGRYTVHKLDKFIRLFNVSSLVNDYERYFIIYYSFTNDTGFGYGNITHTSTKFPSYNNIEKRLLSINSYHAIGITNIQEVREEDLETFKS